MILIDRGPEPEELVLARDEHLARARLRGGPPDEVQGYEVVRDMLTARQIYKCAYCELTFRDEAAPIEHYRPKGRADDVDWSGLSVRKRPSDLDREDEERFARELPPSRSGFDRIRWIRRTGGYWWLSWTWENLAFGCPGCNTGVKLTRFPQLKAASALRALEAPPGDERPLLLDPTDSASNPLDHLQYRQVRQRWIPTARDGSARGAWTIALLRLDTSPGLLTAYDRRVRRLEACVRALDHATTADDAAIQSEWARLCEDVLAPNEELLGLTYDWLDARYPASWRDDHGLVLAKPVLRAPGLGPPVSPRPAVASVEGLEGLPPPLADFVRVARNFRVPTGERLQPSIEQKPLSELVAELLVHRPDATDEELGALLLRSATTIRKYRR